MTSIITGDIINSRENNPQIWMPLLKDVLNKYGSEPTQWEIYRGDSFQIEIPPIKALKVAILIKASIKQFKKLDVRIAIGIGDKSYTSKKITESNGSAFVNSGKCFEQLKKNILEIKSPFKGFDIQMNLLLELALLTMNNWTPKFSEILKIAIENPNTTQKELAKRLNKSQSTISESLNKAGYEEIIGMERHYQKLIKNL